MQRGRLIYEMALKLEKKVVELQSQLNSSYAPCCECGGPPTLVLIGLTQVTSFQCRNMCCPMQNVPFVGLPAWNSAHRKEVIGHALGSEAVGKL